MRVRLSSHLAYFHLLRDPWDNLVQNVGERGGCLEPQQIPRLANRRCSLLDIVLVSGIADVAEWLARAVDFLPNHLRQFQNSRAYRRGKIEVLVQSGWVFDTNADPARQISTVGVVAHLFTVTQNVERILT